MRKRGLIYLAVIAIIVAVIAYFTQDKFLERQLESGLEAIAGAKVEIDNFHFSLLKAECSWSRLQIANANDPWKNLVETGRASFDLETRPLFWRRFIIKEMALERVRTGTPRKTNGSLPKKPEPPKSTEPDLFERAKAALQKQLGDAPIFDLSGLGKKLKVDSLINVENLASFQAYQSLRSTADSTFDYWKSQLDVKVYSAKVNELESKVKSLKLEKIDEIKDVAAVVDLAKKVDDIRKDALSLKKDVEQKHAALTQTFDELQAELKSAQGALQQDIDKAKQLAKLKDLDVKDVALVLFGSAVVDRYEQLLDYVATGRKYLDKVQKMTASDKVEKPPRFKGQDIHFPFRYRYPKFLLRQAKLSAATAAGDTSRAYFLEGYLTGLTNQPSVLGRPTRFNIDLMRLDGNKYRLAGSLDHITDQSRDSLWLSAENFGLGKINLKKSKYFPAAISAQKGNIMLAGFFVSNSIDLKLNLDVSPVNFIYESEATDRVSKIVREVLGGLTNVNLKAQLIGGAGADFKLNLNSNVDNVLANQIKLTIAENLREAQQQVESYVRTEVDKKRKQVEAIIDENRQKVYAELDQAKQKVYQITNELEQRKKELEERKKKLESDAKKKVIDFIRKPGN
ncbi:MAG: TIGR03545 family protein [candidate division KSB1 bacterium]|nr:TIGR03545 family protein [candidate division KSB1 bacterium]